MAPSKKTSKCPIMCFTPLQKDNLLHYQNQRYIGIFMSQRETEKEGGEGERERARGGERAREIAKERAGGGARAREKEKDKKKERKSISKPPGPE
jgi:hypothetical protein